MWSTGDIVSSYKSAKNKKRQINILAELNGVDSYTIRKILKDAGCDLDEINSKGSKNKKWTDEILDEMRRLIEEGYSFQQIAEKMSLDTSKTTAKQMYSKIHADVMRMRKLNTDKEVEKLKEEAKVEPQKATVGGTDEGSQNVSTSDSISLSEGVYSFMASTISQLKNRIDDLSSSISEKEDELVKLRKELDSSNKLLIKLENIQKGGV